MSHDAENGRPGGRPDFGDRPAPGAASDLPSLLVYNERIKYTATWLNTIAAGAIVVGVVAPLTAWAIGGVLDSSILISFCWLPVGGALHYFVRLLLARLKQERTDERT